MRIRSFKHLRTKLLASTLAVVFLLTAAVLVLVQARVTRQIKAQLASTLRAESRVYAEVERVRREQSQQTARLIANQPSLKALMSTNDRLTVEDGSRSLLATSQVDLLVLENPAGEMLALHARPSDVTAATVTPLLQNAEGGEDWWFINGRLYDVNLVPIVSGVASEERSLGRMALGREIRRDAILSTGAFEKSAFTFERKGRVLLSSLPPDAWADLESALPKQDTLSEAGQEFDVRGERYLASFVELPGDHPVRLYCLQSYDQATSFLHALNRMLVILGAVAVLAGAIIAFLLSRQITRPLEQLVVGTQQLQKGDFEFQIPVRGDDEVADLGRAFAEMRDTLKKSRENMLRSARMEAVGRLAGGVAHDFNNLVMIIKGYSDMLLDSAAPESRPHLEEIKRAGDRASALTRQLLAFSRKQMLETQILDPNQTVRNMVKLLRVLIGEDVELVTTLSDQIGRVQVDPGQLEQVVMNLAVNARDAMPDGGKLTIETLSAHLDETCTPANSEARTGDYVLIAVTDTGTGMSKETLQHIFEPFFTTKEQGKGTGLGLATVYGIVKQSKGHISVYSEPGMGTTFKVYLPSISSNVAAKAPQNVVAVQKGHGTVLLVEDEPALRLLAAASLKKLGYTVLESGNGVEALAAADAYSGKIDVVVADIVMPQMGGPELVEKLRAKRENLAVIFMSGYTESATLERAKIGTESMLLNKPFSTETLSAKIQELQQKSMPIAKATAAGGAV